MHSLEKLKKLNKKAIVVISHPDDESLFMGGTIAEFKKWKWVLLCVTDCDERYNKRRRQELLMACGIYKKGGSKVRPVFLEVRKKNGKFSRPEIFKRIKGFIAESGPFDILFTHGSEGDYGHKTHKLVYSAVKMLKNQKIYNFSAPSPRGCPQSIRLSPGTRRIKRQAINVYLKGSQKTNLSRLKKLVRYAIHAPIESFHRYN
ncbi:MAG: PIG-L family deacetylase [Candidatus Omnitrophica bacterium]|nr:PIG-L family deacetylase [Candidatus Omnitrophota bacterium]